ncbi:tRNA pseudouridine(55) synthase TruB [Wolbachia endosymbiont of Cruorifilaria tuberocauda]|uniref:tRNA pseudouridine(55) synthase TruB n=1 Tax=Wolbachia endosymbiont of Cruorifilaria tuberocauda TaxID=1812111 RepID=UPI00158B6C7B|nr:tRNA pseudouridine(55) synthase TruB [Wolbachia endosymbiont of Cruorifilaria tuberocauda]QKX01976.1 tRNA pseudouridine(55) synthase TruB [Wolbachia endosymbiont of Cruorifilaria tuberocauda]
MVHGWLNLDKSIGISSAQAVDQVKRIFRIKKAGHLGTLDPLASGVLPIALGEATKTIPYLSCDSKMYNFTIKWGEQRTTDDINGDVTKTSNIKPEYSQINCAIKSFIGEIIQTPPQFSAVKINGIRAYKLARSGQKVNVKPRLVRVYRLELISVDIANNSADFSMKCGSGVYVRSIARDLGIILNCFGHISRLRRTMVGNFREIESVMIEQLDKKDKIIPIGSVLGSMLKVEISREEVRKIREGQRIVLNNLRKLESYDTFCVVNGDVPVAICNFAYGCVRPVRLFNILR